MKLYLKYVVFYFILMFAISVAFEAFIWRDEAIDVAFLLQKGGTALIFALLMSLTVIVLKKANRRERK